MLPTHPGRRRRAGRKGTIAQGDEGRCNKTFKVHLDGYDLYRARSPARRPSPRKEFFYFNDDGSLVALRYDKWKIVFAEQRAHGLDVWQEPFVQLRVPRLYNIRMDPFEESQHGWDNWKWRMDRLFLLIPAQEYVGKFLTTFKEFPPSQKGGSFSLDQVLQKLKDGGSK